VNTGTASQACRSAPVRRGPGTRQGRRRIRPRPPPAVPGVRRAPPSPRLRQAAAGRPPSSSRLGERAGADGERGALQRMGRLIAQHGLAPAGDDGHLRLELVAEELGHLAHQGTVAGGLAQQELLVEGRSRPVRLARHRLSSPRRHPAARVIGPCPHLREPLAARPVNHATLPP